MGEAVIYVIALLLFAILLVVSLGPGKALDVMFGLACMLAYLVIGLAGIGACGVVLLIVFINLHH